MITETISAEHAANLVKSGMWLDYGLANCQPDVFDKALAARKDELENVKIRSCLTMRPRAVIEEDPEGKHFHMFSWHFSGYDRKKHDAGRCNYMPLNLGEVPDYYRRFLDPVDIVILKTCPMDDGGYFNFGPANVWQRAVIERAKVVIVEVNREVPYVCGRDNGVHVSEVDFVIEGDHQPCAELPNPEPGEIDRAVARRIAADIEDGSCLPDRDRRNAECRMLSLVGERSEGFRNPHRDVNRRSGPALPFRPRNRIAQDVGPWQGHLHLCLGLARSLCHCEPQPRLLLPSGGLHQLAAHHHAKRQGGVHQQHHADRLAGSGRFGI